MTNQEKYELVYMIEGVKETIKEINDFVMKKEMSVAMKQRMYDKKRLYCKILDKLKELKEKNCETMQETIEV